MRRHPEAPAAVLGSSCAVARVGLAAAWDGVKPLQLETGRSQKRAEGDWPWPQPSRGGRAGTGKGAAREQVSPAGCGRRVLLAGAGGGGSTEQAWSSVVGSDSEKGIRRIGHPIPSIPVSIYMIINYMVMTCFWTAVFSLIRTAG